MIVALESITIAVAMIAINPSHAADSFPHIRVSADSQVVDMGRSVVLGVSVRNDQGGPAANCLLLPYVNERRWGAHEVTDGQGNALIVLPLPNPGPARIVVRAIPAFFDTHWIWHPRSSSKSAYLLRRFTIGSPVSDAHIRMAVKDHATVYLNGTVVGEASGIRAETRIPISHVLLKEGENVLAVEASNSDGMAAVAAQLHVRTAESEQILVTDRAWQAWERPPAGWPAGSSEPGAPVRVLARLWDTLLPCEPFESWPGNIRREDLFVGRLLPKDAIASESLIVEVRRRPIASRRDPAHLVGMQWGSYFFPGGFYWQTAQAVPLVGFYDTYNADVIRQHALWLMDIGVDFLVADWPIYIPPDEQGNQRWRNRNEFGTQQVHATTMMLEGLAQLRDEGFPSPAMVIMAFLANGPANTKETLNEEVEWLYDYFIRNPRFRNLWLVYEGKPLVLVLYTGGTPVDQLPGPPVDTTRFTVRYMGTQLQKSRMDRYGHWSWMDGAAEPIVTVVDGHPEAVTPTPAYFGLEKGWLGDDARGRRNGATFVRSFKPAIEHRPRFVLFHQWNEFTGQAEGYPYESGIYGDSYSVELSDDIEPTSLTMAGYRGDHGGWGFFYANLTQALVDLLKQPVPQDSLLAVYAPQPDSGAEVSRGSPAPGGLRAPDVVSGKSLGIGWEIIGKPPRSFSLLLDGIKATEGFRESGCTLDLTTLDPGKHVVTVVAEGAVTHYPLARDRMDVRLPDAIPLRVDVPFVFQRE